MSKFEKTPFAPPTPTPFDAPPELPKPEIAPMTPAESACLTLGAVAFFFFFVGGAVVVTSWFVMAVSSNDAQFQMASRANLIAWPVCAVGWAMYRWLYDASCVGSDS